MGIPETLSITLCNCRPPGSSREISADLVGDSVAIVAGDAPPERGILRADGGVGHWLPAASVTRSANLAVFPLPSWATWTLAGAGRCLPTQPGKGIVITASQPVSSSRIMMRRAGYAGPARRLERRCVIGSKHPPTSGKCSACSRGGWPARVSAVSPLVPRGSLSVQIGGPCGCRVWRGLAVGVLVTGSLTRRLFRPGHGSRACP